MDQDEKKSIPIDITEIQLAAVSAAANGILITDVNGIIIWANPAVTELTGYPNQELIGQKTSILKSHEHDQEFYKDLWETITAGKVWRGEMINRKKDGSHYHEDQTITPIKDDSGTITYYIAIKEDITPFRKASNKLKASEERFRLLIDSVHAHFYMSEYTADGHFKNYYISDGFEGLTGYPKERFMEDWQFWSSIVHPDDRPRTDEAVRKILRGHNSELEYRIVRKDGEVIWVADNARVVVQPDGTLLISATIIDITDRKQTENHIRYLATHDPLTSLPNRILFQEMLENSLSYAKRNNQKLAVFFLDLDNFKAVNDTYGHHIGDDLLKAIANRLRGNLRDYDTISRISGDEFTLIAEQIKDPETAQKLAAKIHNFLSGKYQLRQHMVNVSISIGGAIYPDHGEEFDTLLQKADAAMYAAKNSPHTHVKIFNHD
jgi:diguanylate cyclase (GGDEF)-like protein/PAS domain S-box-containing protein